MKENIRQVRNWTKSFKEVQKLLSDHNSLKKQLHSIDRRLKTIEAKHSFLDNITSKNGSGTAIEIATKLLFKSAGFNDVRHLKKVKPLREDLQIWCDDCLILIECKGTIHSIPSDDLLGPIKKYIDHRVNIVKSKLPVFGLTVLNNDNSKNIDKRNKNSIDKHKAEYAEASKYGIITTIELVNGFLLLKNNIITFEQFKNTIKQFGLIKFGVRADKV